MTERETRFGSGWISGVIAASLGVMGFAATFLSPDPLGRVQYAFAPELKHPIHRAFVEMQPTWMTLGQPPFNFVPIYLLAGLVLLMKTRICRVPASMP